MATYNHMYVIAFEVSGSRCPDGGDVTPQRFREAILRRLALLPDNEMLEAIGGPQDTHEEEGALHGAT